MEKKITKINPRSPVFAPRKRVAAYYSDIIGLTLENQQWCGFH